MQSAPDASSGTVLCRILRLSFDRDWKFSELILKYELHVRSEASESSRWDLRKAEINADVDD